MTRSEVDTERLMARLRDVGLDDTVAVDTQMTVRPAEGGSGPTVLAKVHAANRSFPRLSVDLRTAEHRSPSVGSDLEVRGVIGEGGMGRVLIARQHSLARDVAVKTAKPNASDAARAAILDEGAITGHLEHPAIVPVHALGLDAQGHPAMVMKRIEGVTWDTLLEDPRHPGWEGWDGTEADRLKGHLQFLMSICNAVHYASTRGIVHRDIKPDNVLIGTFGDVYLADWGVAGRVGDAGGAFCGTPGNMSPEMVTGDPIDGRTDVYLLGSTLHYVLTGKQRHHGRTLREVIIAAASSTAFDYADEVPPGLAKLANRACHADPEQRPPDAQAFRDSVREYLRHIESQGLTEQAAERVVRAQALVRKAKLSPEERVHLDRVVAEARFGLEQALGQWPENPQARIALGELESLLSSQRTQVQALERLQWDRSPNVSARPRAIVMTALGLSSVGIAITGMLWPAAPTPLELVVFPLTALAVLGVAIVVMRRRLVWNTFNRQAAGVVVLSLGCMVVGRAAGLWMPIAVTDHMVRDAFTLTGIFGVAAFTFVGWSVWLAIVSLATSFACMWYPAYALKIYSVSTAVLVALATLFSWLGNDTAPLSRRLE